METKNCTGKENKRGVGGQVGNAGVVVGTRKMTLSLGTGKGFGPGSVPAVALGAGVLQER